MDRKFDLTERLIDFACGCLTLAERLPTTLTGNLISKQFIRCASSPAIHYGEAQGAESRSDFIHKMKICLKELRETYNCLLLITKLKWINEVEGKTILKENDELIAIFISSCKTAHKNLLINKTYEGPNF